jgi:hypothetical protein
MPAHESLGEQFGPHMGMLAEAVRRDTAKQHGVEHSGPDAPQVTAVRVHDDVRDRFHPQASHHITVRWDDPDVEHHHVYGVNTSNEYMHNHSTAHVVKSTGRANTSFTPG